MQDHFLFDDNDSKQRGVGCDILRLKEDGLVLNWRWGTPHYKENKRYKKIPHQVSSANIGYFTCNAIFWHSYYEAEIKYIDSTLKSYRVREDEGVYLKTRVDAQKKAEKLLLEFYKDMGVLLREKFRNVK